MTAIRTAAVSAVATRALARREAKTLAILGSGVQARSHLEAMLCVLPFERVVVWSRSNERAEAFVRDARATTQVPVAHSESVEQAVFEGRMSS